MSDEYTENKLKLLRILYDLYSGEKRTPIDGPSFTVLEDGTVNLHQDLAQVLENDHHADFISWTKENIAGLA